MDTLINKTYLKYDYKCRYAGVPSYYDTLYDREIMGIGTNLKKDTQWVAHKIKDGDTLDGLALKYYNNPTYWWAIADFNNIKDAFCELSQLGDIIKIPAIAAIEFGDSN